MPRSLISHTLCSISSIRCKLPFIFSSTAVIRSTRLLCSFTFSSSCCKRKFVSREEAKMPPSEPINVPAKPRMAVRIAPSIPTLPPFRSAACKSDWRKRCTQRREYPAPPPLAGFAWCCTPHPGTPAATPRPAASQAVPAPAGYTYSRIPPLS